MRITLHRELATHHSLETMRLQHNKARLSHPFGLAAADELIDDALSGIVEVAELRLPNDQSIGIRHRVSQFESKHAVLRQGTVANRVGSLIRVKVAERPVRRFVDSLMVQDMMPVGECTSLDVLTGQPHVYAFLEQRAESHGLAERPVDLPRLHHFHSGFQNTLDALKVALGKY